MKKSSISKSSLQRSRMLLNDYWDWNSSLILISKRSQLQTKKHYFASINLKLIVVFYTLSVSISSLFLV